MHVIHAKVLLIVLSLRYICLDGVNSCTQFHCVLNNSYKVVHIHDADECESQS